MARNKLIQIRRDTAANWSSVNPVLASGEAGLETDTLNIKYGNGSTAWNSLSYPFIKQAALDLKQDLSEKNQINGYAGLDGTGKISSTLLPSLVITDTFAVSSQSAMLALSAQQGDIAVRSDLNKTFILTNNDPATLSSWQELLTPTDSVLSYNGRTGAVIPVSGDYTATMITNTPAGNIASTTVQAALNELDTEKVAKSGDTMTGTLTVPSVILTSGNFNSSSTAGLLRISSGTIDNGGVIVMGGSTNGSIPNLGILRVGTTNIMTWSTNGITLHDAKNIFLDTVTGTKIGTAANQKLSLWNKTPIVQPTTSITGATRVGGGGTTLTDTDTFGGYTVAQIAQALIGIGILA